MSFAALGSAPPASSACNASKWPFLAAEGRPKFGVRVVGAKRWGVALGFTDGNRSVVVVLEGNVDVGPALGKQFHNQMMAAPGSWVGLGEVKIIIIK